MNNLYFIISKLLAPLLNPINFFILVLFFLYLINLKKKNRILKSIQKFILVILLLIGFLPVGDIGLKFLENEYINDHKLDKIDNIIVLGGVFNTNSSLITGKTDLNENSDRLIASIKLSLEFPGSKIFFIGGDANLIPHIKNEIDIAKNFYREIGFNLNKIEFLSNSRNTNESFKNLKNINMNNKKNVLVTSAYHMKRALIISRYYDLDLIPYAVDFKTVSRTNMLYKYQYFDILNNYLRFNLFIREMFGLIAFRILF